MASATGEKAQRIITTGGRVVGGLGRVAGAGISVCLMLVALATPALPPAAALAIGLSSVLFLAPLVVRAWPSRWATIVFPAIACGACLFAGIRLADQVALAVGVAQIVAIAVLAVHVTGRWTVIVSAAAAGAAIALSMRGGATFPVFGVAAAAGAAQALGVLVSAHRGGDRIEIPAGWALAGLFAILALARPDDVASSRYLGERLAAAVKAGAQPVSAEALAPVATLAAAPLSFGPAASVAGEGIDVWLRPDAASAAMIPDLALQVERSASGLRIPLRIWMMPGHSESGRDHARAWVQAVREKPATWREATESACAARLSPAASTDRASLDSILDGTILHALDQQVVDAPAVIVTARGRPPVRHASVADAVADYVGQPTSR